MLDNPTRLAALWPLALLLALAHCAEQSSPKQTDAGQDGALADGLSTDLYQRDGRKDGTGRDAPAADSASHDAPTGDGPLDQDGPLSSAWSGPKVEVVDHHGFARLKIDGTLHVPFFFAANTQGGLQDDWDALDRQVELAAQHGVPIIQVTMGAGGWRFSAQSPLSAEVRAIFDRVVSKHPSAYLLPRVYVHAPNDEKMVLQDLAGNNQAHVFNTLSPTWLAARKVDVAALLEHLDAQYPGKIMGIHLGYLNTAEWFFPEVENGSFPDYSSAAAADFCAWQGLPAGNAACTVPSAAERNRTTLGNTLLTGPDAVALRAARFNRYLSHQVTRAISGLAETTKQVSDNKAFTMAFYGYLYALSDGRLTSSGHLDLRGLLASPHLDALAAPYQYSRDSRDLDKAMLPHGPSDSPWLHGKLWVHEDDTRTHLCTPWQTFSCTQDQNLTETVFYERRNAYTAAFHQNGLYFFDLLLGGWFGKSNESSSSDIWLNLQLVRNRVEGLSRDGAVNLEPQVAVFVDDRSSSYLKVTGGAGGSAEFNRSLSKEPVAALSRIGAPIRHYLLSDLAHADFPADSIRLAVFLNVMRVDQSMRRVIAQKLQRNGKTLVYVFAPGVMDDNETASASLASALTGIDLVLNTNNASLSTEIQDAGPVAEIRALAGQRYGPTYGVGPWLHADDSNTIVLGRYFGRGQAALVLKELTSHRVVFSGATGIPSNVWRALAGYAGVHLYAPLNTTIEALGNALLVHTSRAGAVGITLPQTVAKVTEDLLSASSPLCSGCDSFQTSNLQAGNAVLYWLE